METLDTVWLCPFQLLTPPGRKVILLLSAVYFSPFKNLSASQYRNGHNAMRSKTPGSNEEKQSDMESGCNHFSSSYLGNPWECQKDPDENSLLSVKGDDK